MKRILSTICVFSVLGMTALSAAPAKKKPAPPEPAAVTAADLNASQGEISKPAASPQSMAGRIYLEAFGGYGFTYGGILSKAPSSGSAAFTGDPRAGLLFAWHWGPKSALVVAGSYNSKSPGITGSSTSPTYRTTYIAGALGFRFYSTEHLYAEVGGYYGHPFGDWKLENSAGSFAISTSDRVADIGLYIAGGYLFHLGEKLRLNIGINLQLGITQVAGNLTANNMSLIGGLGYLF